MKPIKLIFLSLAFPLLAFAHGGEDHSHDEAPASRALVSGQPRVEAATETFEIVGQTGGDGLVLLVDRYDTNEPVLNGAVEVELNGIRAQAAYRPDYGDYLVQDKALMKALSAAGRHPLVLTVTAGNDMDLLEATMVVADDGHARAADGKGPIVSLGTAAIAGIVLTLILAAIAVALARRPSTRGNQT